MSLINHPFPNFGKILSTDAQRAIYYAETICVFTLLPCMCGWIGLCTSVRVRNYMIIMALSEREYV